MLTRSLFFAPANRPDLVGKFPRIGADCFVIDLEDGTPAADKIAARAALPAVIEELRANSENLRVFIRVNQSDSELHEQDVLTAASCAIDGIVLPKVETIDSIAWVADELGTAGRPPAVIGGVESVKGVLSIEQLTAAKAGLVAVYFGAEDLASNLNARRTPEGLEVLYMRSRVVLAACAADIEAIDQAVVEVRDDNRFLEDSRRGRDLGYVGKICLLPRQVELAHQAFSPSSAEVERAKRIVDVYNDAVKRGLGTVDVDGQMIDAPLVTRAQNILAVVTAK